MSVSVGELFVNLGIKGADKTLSAIVGVKGAFSETKGMATETKLAILGAVYALEEWASSVGRVATATLDFNALTGISTQTIQQYQNAFKVAGLASEDAQKTFYGLEDAMNKALHGMGEFPAGLDKLIVGLQKAGVAVPETLQQIMQDPTKLFQYLRQYAMSEKDIYEANLVLSTFLPKDLIPKLREGKLGPEDIAKQPWQSKGQLTTLNSFRESVAKMEIQLEMEFAKIVAKYGPGFIKDIEIIIKPMIKLFDAIGNLVAKVHGMEVLEKAAVMFGKFIDFMTATVDKFASLYEKKPIDQETFWEKFSKGHQTPMGAAWDSAGSLLHFLDDAAKSSKNNDIPWWGHLLPKTPEPPAKGDHTQNVEVNQNFAFDHPGQDYDQIGNSVSRAIKTAFVMFPRGQAV